MADVIHPSSIDPDDYADWTDAQDDALAERARLAKELEADESTAGPTTRATLPRGTKSQ